jgi:hypothetical protein
MEKFKADQEQPSFDGDIKNLETQEEDLRAKAAEFSGFDDYESQMDSLQAGVLNEQIEKLKFVKSLGISEEEYEGNLDLFLAINKVFDFENSIRIWQKRQSPDKEAEIRRIQGHLAEARAKLDELLAKISRKAA